MVVIEPAKLNHLGTRPTNIGGSAPLIPEELNWEFRPYCPVPPTNLQASSPYPSRRPAPNWRQHYLVWIVLLAQGIQLSYPPLPCPVPTKVLEDIPPDTSEAQARKTGAINVRVDLTPSFPSWSYLTIRVAK